MGITVTKLAQLAGHRDAVYGLDVGNDGKVYSGGADGYIVEWDPEVDVNGNLLATLHKAVYAVRYFDDLLLAGSAIGEMLVIDLKNKNAVFHEKVHPGGIFDFFVDREHIYIFGEKGYVTVLNRDYRITDQKQLLEESIRMALPYAGERLLLACSDNSFKIVDRATLNLHKEIQAHAESVFSLALDADKNRLYTGSRDATIKVWDMEKNEELMQVQAHLYHVNGLALNPLNNLLLSASMDKTIRIWNAEDMRLLKVVDLPKFGMHGNSVNKVLWIGPNRFISCSDDRTLGHFQVDLSAV